jgi:flavin reductase (DIM6/NTAB) family NADH-FMN oxidoreductase RutF
MKFDRTSDFVIVVLNRWQPADGLHQRRSRSDGDVEKDTLSNVEETGEFVVNIVSLSLSNTMHESSKNHPPESGEVPDLTPIPAMYVPGVNAEDIAEIAERMGN